MPSACQVNSSNGQVHWCTKLLPSAAGGVQLAQAAVVEWAQVSVWLSSMGVLYALRHSDGAVVWNITLDDAGTKVVAVPAAPLALDPFKVRRLDARFSHLSHIIIIMSYFLSFFFFFFLLVQFKIFSEWRCCRARLVASTCADCQWHCCLVR